MDVGLPEGPSYPGHSPPLEGSLKQEVVKMSIFFYASTPISIVLDKIGKRIALSFNLAQKTPFIDGMI